MFDRIKKFFNMDEPQEQLVVEPNVLPPTLYEVIVNGPGISHTYSDIIWYNFEHTKNGTLELELKTLTHTKATKYIYYAKGSWAVVMGGLQNVKDADMDIIKTAWESPTAGFPSLDDK